MIITVNNKTYGLKNVLIDENIYLYLGLDKVKINVEYNKSKKDFYAYIIKDKKKLRLHRYIMNCPRNLVVDHINGNALDNRLENLRICTQRENTRNRKDSLTFSAKQNNKLRIRGLSLIYDCVDKRYYYRFKLKGYKTRCFALSRKDEAIEYAKHPDEVRDK